VLSAITLVSAVMMLIFTSKFITNEIWTLDLDMENAEKVRLSA
jgi:hypothetical protein